MIWKTIILMILLCGCYNEKKATQQFNKAALSYPQLPAAYCSDHFPVRDSIIKGDTVLTFDTLYIEGDTVFIPYKYTGTEWTKMVDTVFIRSASRIITKTVTITDTIFRENKAELKLCEIYNDKLTDLLVKKTNESDGFQRKAKKRGIIMWSLIGFIILIVGLNIYLKANKIRL